MSADAVVPGSQQVTLPEAPVCVGPVHHEWPARVEIVVRTKDGHGLCEVCLHFYNRATTRRARREGLLASGFRPVTEAGRQQLNKWLQSVGLPPGEGPLCP